MVNIGFGEEITQAVSIEVKFMHIIWSDVCFFRTFNLVEVRRHIYTVLVFNEMRGNTYMIQLMHFVFVVIFLPDYFYGQRENW